MSYSLRVVAEFVLPGQPIPKARPRKARNGHIYTPRETLDRERVVGYTYRQYSRGYPRIPREYDVELEVNFYFRDLRYGDLDNCVKLVQDGLNGIAYVDDKQIARLTTERFLDRENPRTEIRFAYRVEDREEEST